MQAPPPSTDVVLVDDTDQVIGLMEKAAAHEGHGHLHRAVSMFVVDHQRRALLQRRALTKGLFGGRWSNACCTHPHPGENPADAATRRVLEEIGLHVEALHRAGSFVYRAPDPGSGLVEWEYDHVYVTSVDSSIDVSPDPEEVMDWTWVPLDRLPSSSRTEPEFTPWLAPVVDLVRRMKSDH